MVITRKIGNVSVLDFPAKQVDYVHLEWYETNKRILHKTSEGGMALKMKFLDQNPNFRQGDVIVENKDSIVVINILPCDCMVFKPRTFKETAAIAYEIGNHHLPLFFEQDELLAEYEKPLFNYFTSLQYDVRKVHRKLLYPLKTTVEPHSNSEGLFTKIMKLTQSNT